MQFPARFCTDDSWQGCVSLLLHNDLSRLVLAPLGVATFGNSHIWGGNIWNAHMPQRSQLCAARHHPPILTRRTNPEPPSLLLLPLPSLLDLCPPGSTPLSSAPQIRHFSPGTPSLSHIQPQTAPLPSAAPTGDPELLAPLGLHPPAVTCLGCLHHLSEAHCTSLTCLLPAAHTPQPHRLSSGLALRARSCLTCLRSPAGAPQTCTLRHLLPPRHPCPHHTSTHHASPPQPGTAHPCTRHRCTSCPRAPTRPCPPTHISTHHPYAPVPTPLPSRAPRPDSPPQPAPDPGPPAGPRLAL